MVEPGSTFKIVTTSAVIEEKLVTPETTIFCENGHFQYAGRVLRDAHPMGLLTVHQILEKSSNIGVAKLALQLGDTKLYEYVRRFGFGERTGVALTGEIPGLVNPPHRWSKLDITRIPMGQSVAVTPIQMVTAMSTIANGGKLMKPMIISKIMDPDGRPVATFQPEVVRQVISRETTKKITAALKDVVSKQGTAQHQHAEHHVHQRTDEVAETRLQHTAVGNAPDVAEPIGGNQYRREQQAAENGAVGEQFAEAAELTAHAQPDQHQHTGPGDPMGYHLEGVDVIQGLQVQREAAPDDERGRCGQQALSRQAW